MKELGIYLFLTGLLLFIIGSIYKIVFKVKDAAKEIEVIQRRGMLGKAYTVSLDEKTPVYTKNTQNEYETSLLEESSEQDEYKTQLL